MLEVLEVPAAVSTSLGSMPLTPRLLGTQSIATRLALEKTFRSFRRGKSRGGYHIKEMGLFRLTSREIRCLAKKTASLGKVDS